MHPLIRVKYPARLWACCYLSLSCRVSPASMHLSSQGCILNTHFYVLQVAAAKASPAEMDHMQKLRQAKADSVKQMGTVAQRQPEPAAGTYKLAIIKVHSTARWDIQCFVLFCVLQASRRLVKMFCENVTGAKRIQIAPARVPASHSEPKTTDEDDWQQIPTRHAPNTHSICQRQQTCLVLQALHAQSLVGLDFQAAGCNSMPACAYIFCQL